MNRSFVIRLLLVFSALFNAGSAFGKLRDSSLGLKPLKSKQQQTSAFRIGVIEQIKGKQIVVRLRPGMHVSRKKKGVQVASSQLSQVINALPHLITGPDMVDSIYAIISDLHGRKVGKMKFMHARSRQKIIFEYDQREGEKLRPGWSISLLGPRSKLGTRKVDLGVSYELRW